MYTVYTTLNNKLTYEIFKSCIQKDYSLTLSYLYNSVDRYNNKTFIRVFAFVWNYGLNSYFRTLHSLDRKNYNRLENAAFDTDLHMLNKLIQKYKSKGGVLK